MTTAHPLRTNKVASAPLAVFVATRAEMRPIITTLQSTRQSASRSGSMMRIAVGNRVLLLARTGVGPDHAEATACRLLDETPIAAAVSLGVAGGLSPQAQTGDLIVGNRVILRRNSRLESFPCDSDLQDTAATILRRWGSRHCLGPILTVDRIVLTEEKHRLAVESGAMALDMESAAIASAAAARSIPFLVVRGVLDTVDEDLAMGFDQFLDGRGEPQPLPLIRYLITHPFTVPHMVGLGLRTKAVCARLGLLLQELSTSLS